VSLARLLLADLDGAAAAAAQARPAAVAARDHLATSVAVVSLALVSEVRGDLGDALQIIDEAVMLADESPGRLGHRFPLHGFRGYILTALGRLDEARSTLETGMRISEELGIPWGLSTVSAFALWSVSSRGTGTMHSPRSRWTPGWRACPARATASSSAAACCR
jgi:MalT-like TPR region